MNPSDLKVLAEMIGDDDADPVVQYERRYFYFNRIMEAATYMRALLVSENESSEEIVRLRTIREQDDRLRDLRGQVVALHRAQSQVAGRCPCNVPWAAEGCEIEQEFNKYVNQR